MYANLPLLNQAALAGMAVLNRIFQRQNMTIEMLVEVFHHCRQRGGFPASRRPGHQNQSVLAAKERG